MTKIQAAADRLIKKYGSVRKAAAACGINHSYLHKLYRGDSTRPTPRVLGILGLEQRIDYIRAESTHDQ
jgi:hypothetical protein